jgi:hypothetical protein
LKEIASEKDMVGPFSVSEEVVVVKLSHGHMNVLMISWWCTIILNISIENLGMPTELASGEEEDIAQGGIERVSVKDAHKTSPMVAIQDDVLRTSGLVTITWQNNCYLIHRSIRCQIAMPVTPRIKAKGNLTLLLWSHGTCQLKSLNKMANSRVVAIKHVLEGAQSGLSQVGIPRIAKTLIKSSLSLNLRVRNVELRVDLVFARRWQKRPNSVNELSTDPEGVRCRLSILIECYDTTHFTHFSLYLSRVYYY